MTSFQTFSARCLATAAACALALLPVAQTNAQSKTPVEDLRYDNDVVQAIQMAEAPRQFQMSAARTEPDVSGFDVRKYTIRCAVDFGTQTISARTTIDATATQSALTSVSLDFVGLSVTSVTVNGASASFSRAGGRLLTVTLPRAFNSGESFAIDVSYAGRPTIEGGLGFGFVTRGAATFAEPQGARLWYPCKDRPSDKASYEGFVTVPTGYVVASNGALLETIDNGDSTTYHWRESHQISTYLISLAISRYRIIEDNLGTLPIQHFVYPELETSARRDFSRTPEMIQTFETYLGVPYAFDKYGHALFENFGGAMEHQSCTSYGANLITGDNRYDRVVAHELGHQWFGDLVSPAEWEEIWLNEGFATWTEFLWTEHYNPSILPQLMASRENTYIDYEDRIAQYALYNPPPSRLFGTTIYQKGGWVVSMLRYVLGDEAFFAGLKLYIERHANGNARSTDLKAALEEASGQDLTAFFDEWVYRAGYPKYQTGWTSRAVPGGKYQLDVRIRQTQSGQTTYTTPMEVAIELSDGQIVRQRVAITSRDSITSICLDGQPVRASFDPDNRILGPIEATNVSVTPQPAQCAEETSEIQISGVAYLKNGGAGTLQVVGEGFIVGDSRIEVDGVVLKTTKYPKNNQNPDGTTSLLIGKHPKLKRDIVPLGASVQIVVFNESTGSRSDPVTFTRSQ